VVKRPGREPYPSLSSSAEIKNCRAIPPLPLRLHGIVLNRDYVTFCLYKMTCKTLVLYMLLFTFLDSRREDESPERNGSKHSPNLICSLFPHESNFDLFLSFPKI
jgi:hypothetical protein